MKRLTIYTGGSFFTYDDLYVKYQYERKENDVIVIYKVDDINGDESICAIYREWQYIEIEDDEND